VFEEKVMAELLAGEEEREPDMTAGVEVAENDDLGLGFRVETVDGVREIYVVHGQWGGGL
jgi:hypothetical protein